MEHHLVDASGVRWHVVTAGAGPVVVLAAGFPQSWWAWRHVIPLLARHHSVLAIDLPGQGDSGPSPVGYAPWDVAGPIAGLLDALGLAEVTFVGLDVGAWVGFALGYRSPDRLRALALVDGNIAGINLNLDDDDGHGGWHFLFQRVPELPEAMLVGHERRVIEWFSSRMTRHRDVVIHTQADLDEYERAYAADVPGRDARVLPGRPTNERVNTALTTPMPVPVPVLTIKGARSGSSKLAEGLRDRTAHATSIVLTDTGHYVPEERPAEVAAAITTLVKSVAATP
ncbi:alpha/beta hydrolase [Curtobacterium flaccumfaciens pv. flaccumfaciens]|uniref:alpha/beta fold hydrolase n=1 Tax=Curtobacterium TaxID=2034 RepID=UPI00217E3438|nr:alpha/beta hydrolase [Curtobacterium flaccumfaciens]MCS6553341.1 alpha/beta hydrolase [Curtobacterium flaccumfaciens pv. flaccumfaciens]MCS6567161.1 alpha/beta hydrolase [Curtobacterium flaccumfaciens pv. flaccumfaciens]MCS6570409.1 alpha/beta hydrolase [Curtobacterium flaccumfaciens pv. flaccumfaciens]MCS6586907.1 alpha/beta hydrolase [Curtobacterium flaccumfaciens pv. flaccumfaciens]